VQDLVTAVNIKTVAQPRYSPDMAPAVHFLFPRVKAELEAISTMQETFRKAWDGVLLSIAKEDFVAAFQR
jgi:hypothetical protein